MKRTIIKLCFLIISQISFGQACGIYELKYIGEIHDDNIELLKVKLPSVSFLHGYENETNVRYIEAELKNRKFECNTFSMITSSLYDKAITYYKMYKRVNKFIPISLTIIENNIEKEIQIKIPWKKIKMKYIKGIKHKKMLQINLGEIILN